MTAGTPQAVFLVGDQNLVREFGEECLKHGCAATAKLNAKGSGIPSSIRISQKPPSRKVALGVELTMNDRDRKRSNLLFLERSLPKETPILTSSVFVTVTEQAQWIKHPERLIGISAFPSLLKNPLIEIALPLQVNSHEVLRRVELFLQTLSKQFSIVQDRVGMVMPRMFAMLVNEAFFALTEQIASPQDIDTAMKLGTNYPRGLIEWGNLVGISLISSLLTALHEEYGDDRYRIAPLLLQMAHGREFW